MKTEFKAKFLQHVAKRKREEGFTLIELLVVIIIIGILSAIALPSFLNQANKAKQSEAKQYLSSINKGIQAHYAEESGFKVNQGQPDERDLGITDLGLGISTLTTNYKYAIEEIDDLGNGNAGMVAKAGPPTNTLLGYVSAVGLLDVGQTNTTTSSTILCQQEVAGNDFDANLGELTNPIAEPEQLKCDDTNQEKVK